MPLRARRAPNRPTQWPNLMRNPIIRRVRQIYNTRFKVFKIHRLLKKTRLPLQVLRKKAKLNFRKRRKNVTRKRKTRISRTLIRMRSCLKRPALSRLPSKTSFQKVNFLRTAMPVKMREYQTTRLGATIQFTLER